MDWLIDSCQHPLVIRYYLVAEVHLTFIYQHIKRGYQSLLYKKPAEWPSQRREFGRGARRRQTRGGYRVSLKGKFSGVRRERQSGASVGWDVVGLDGDLYGQKRHDDELGSLELSEDNEELDEPLSTFTHIPKQVGSIAFYKSFANVFMVFIMIKSIFPEPLYLFKSDPSIPDACYVPGRLALDFSTLSGFTSALFSFFHLIWRLRRVRSNEGLRADLVLYLLENDDELLAFLNGVKRRSIGFLGETSVSGLPSTRSAFYLAPAYRSTDRPPLLADLRGSTGTRFFEMSGDTLTEAALIGSECRNMGVARKRALLLRHLLFYRVRQGDEVYYKLRTHRTMQARAELKREFAVNFLIVSSFFAIAGTILFLLCLMVVLFDWSYERKYPGCSAGWSQHVWTKWRPLGDAYGEDWAVTITSHRVIVFLFDVVENLVVWFDSGYSLSFNHSFMILINQDLLIYWRNLHTKIELTLRMVRDNYEIRDQMNICASLASTFPYRHQTTRTRPNRNQQVGSGASSSSKSIATGRATTPVSLAERDPSNRPDRETAEAPVPQLDIKTPYELERAILELQAEITDFFSRIESVKWLVSDHMTAMICIWFVTFAFLSYHSIVRSSEHADVPFVVHLIQIYHITTISITSLFLFRLRASCLKSYREICSLMAYDHSIHKRRFTEILDFYTNQSRFNYSLFRQIAYTPSTYLSIIGSTFSCFFIIESLSKYARFKAYTEM